VETPHNGVVNIQQQQASSNGQKKSEASTLLSESGMNPTRPAARFKSANNSAMNQKIRKQISLESTSPNSSLNEPSSSQTYDEDHHAVLVNGLKSLSIKQQERVYSAGKIKLNIRHQTRITLPLFVLFCLLFIST
jgi:hypothetical protein